MNNRYACESNNNVWIELHVLLLCQIRVFLCISLSPLTAKWKVCCFWQTDSLFCLFFSVLFSLWFLYLSLHCCFPPSSFTLFLLIFHALLYFPGFMPSICNPNIHPIHSPTTVSLYGCYINPHFLALPTTLHLLAPHTFCWPPPPQWPLHPVRGFCCRITLSLLRSELCCPPITMTGEVTLMRSYLTPPSTGPRDPNHFCHPCDQQPSLDVNFKYSSIN